MNINPLLPQDRAFWYLNLDHVKPLTEHITADVVVIGGGMAGLTTAQSFLAKGCSVVLLEKNYCGSGATGHSSGFITPDAELSLSELITAYGFERGHQLWQFIESGVNHIRNNIKTYNLDCDYSVQPTCVVASKPKAFLDDLTEEHKARERCGYDSSLYTKAEQRAVIGSEKYYGAIVYDKTFGINAARYCAQMRDVLVDSGVRVYEESPVIEVKDQLVCTAHGSVKAKYIIMCTDRAAGMLPQLNTMVSTMQNFLIVSAPLTDATVRKIFPREPLMVWDTELVYNYYRLAGENRLLLGGGSLWYTYSSKESHNNAYMIKQFKQYAATYFPHVDIQWEYFWPGLIGISKDLFPVAGFDKNIPSLYYITAAAGLPWAAALGMHSAEHVINGNKKFDDLLSPYRKTTLGPITQAVLGKKLTFALSNYLVVGSV